MSNRLPWVDLETFGLDPERHPIIEVGVKLTDLELRTIDTFHALIWENGLYDTVFKNLHKSASEGNKDSRYVIAMHDKSELWDDARANGVSLWQAEEDFHNWLDKHNINGTDPLAGSSVGFDREMLKAWMPDIEERFHYRNVDISSVKELCARYNPRVYDMLAETTQPQKLHRSMEDLEDTIGEFEYYLNNFLFTTEF